MHPIVTVITPTFNRADFLPETLDSVLTQDYPHVEHLVLDDGSTDATPDLVSEYQSRFPERLTSARHANVGQVRTINRGFSMASGSLFLIVNSDDLLLPGAISKLVRRWERDKSALAVFPDFRVIDEEGGTVVDILTQELSIADRVRLQADVGAGVLFTRSMVDQLGGWNPEYRTMPDLEFWIRGGLLGHYLHLPEVVATWRRHSGAITVASSGSESIAERFRFLDELFARPDLPDSVRETRSEAYRNMHVIAAITMLPDFNRPQDRFVILDRLAWVSDARARESSVEEVLLAEREHSARLAELVGVRERELISEREHSARLAELVGVRDAELVAERQMANAREQMLTDGEARIEEAVASISARDVQLAEVRAHARSLEQRLTAITSSLPWRVGRRVAPRALRAKPDVR